MGIIQENMANAPRPAVTETKYGAQYVVSATETPVVSAGQSSSSDAPLPDAAGQETAETEAPVVEKKSVRGRRKTRK